MIMPGWEQVPLIDWGGEALIAGRFQSAEKNNSEARFRRRLQSSFELQPPFHRPRAHDAIGLLAVTRSDRDFSRYAMGLPGRAIISSWLGECEEPRGSTGVDRRFVDFDC